MPLSEHEQKMLEEIERRLAAEDPKFARQVRFPAPQKHSNRRVKRAGAAFAAGFALLIAGLLLPDLLIFFGLAAFGVMLGAVVVIAATMRGAARKPTDAATQTGASPWFSRLEERWRKRFERGDDR